MAARRTAICSRVPGVWVRRPPREFSPWRSIARGARPARESAAPILSRLQRFDFRRIGPHAIVERLRHVAAAEGLAVEDDAFHLIAKSADGGMRDALSILDQVLSFGEGPVTAGRVREVLGLISDELYGELLRVVAGRDVRGG